jgi:hypothetical protein
MGNPFGFLNTERSLFGIPASFAKQARTIGPFADPVATLPHIRAAVILKIRKLVFEN